MKFIRRLLIEIYLWWKYRNLQYEFYKILFLELRGTKFMLPIFTSNMPLEIVDPYIKNKEDIGFLLISGLPDVLKNSNCDCSLLATPGFLKLDERMQMTLILLEVSHLLMNHVTSILKYKGRKRIIELENCLLESDEIPIRCGYATELAYRVEKESKIYEENTGKTNKFHVKRLFNIERMKYCINQQNSIDMRYLFFDDLNDVPKDVLWKNPT